MAYTFIPGDHIDGGDILHGPAPRPRVIDSPRVVTLDGADPYGATQCDDTIRDGDVLVVPGVAVGVLVEAWPILVSGDGEDIGFHELSDDADIRWLGQQGWGRDFPAEWGYLPPRGGGDYTASFALAQAELEGAL
jgi:hypothetical protein